MAMTTYNNSVAFLWLLLNVSVICCARLDNNVDVKVNETNSGNSTVIKSPFKINLFDINIDLDAETNYQERKDDGICDHYIIFKLRDNAIKIREKPKGRCINCCRVKYNDIKFVLYTKSKPTKGEILPYENIKHVKDRGLDKNLKTVIFVHGFLEISPGGSGLAFIDAYFSREETYNVILVDWSDLVSFPWYFEAAANTKIAGEALAKFLETYNDQGEIPIENVHVVGFSLGAHVAGFAAKLLRKDLRLKRITGLDPAYPSFATDFTQRLAATDAEFVDIIHTDKGNFGIPYPIGDADFYPNMEEFYQPGCMYRNLMNENSLHDILSCNHVRAWKLYAESVKNPLGFPASKCRRRNGLNKRCAFTADAYMGFLANKNDSGIFFLDTNSRYPYARNLKEE